MARSTRLPHVRQRIRISRRTIVILAGSPDIGAARIQPSPHRTIRSHEVKASTRDPRTMDCSLRWEVLDAIQPASISLLWKARAVPAGLRYVAPSAGLACLAHRSQGFQHGSQLGRADTAELPGQVGGAGAAGAGQGSA